jgi:hypothetical protein
MLIKSGLGSEDLTQMSTLDIDGARRLQHLSAQYEKKTTGNYNTAIIPSEAKGKAEPPTIDILSN